MTNSMHVRETILDLRANQRGSNEELDRRLHRYYLACCRRIWKLLPQEASRRGVELGEQYVDGNLTDEQLHRTNYDVEGAAFRIDYNTEPDRIDEWVREVERIPRDELLPMLNGVEPAMKIDCRELLRQAAYFADFAMVYPQLQRKNLPDSYSVFLEADLFRRIVGDASDPASALHTAEPPN